MIQSCLADSRESSHEAPPGLEGPPHPPPSSVHHTAPQHVRQVKAKRPERSGGQEVRRSGGQEVRRSGGRERSNRSSKEVKGPRRRARRPPWSMLRFREAGRSASSSASTGEAGLAKPRAVSGSAGTAYVCVPVWPAGSTAGLLPGSRLAGSRPRADDRGKRCSIDPLFGHRTRFWPP
jgi:hypothetical protein